MFILLLGKLVFVLGYFYLPISNTNVLLFSFIDGERLTIVSINKKIQNLGKIDRKFPFKVKAQYGAKLVQSPIKLKVDLPYVDKTNCTKKYAEGNIKLSASQFCAGGMKAKDSCSGKLY